MDFSDIFYLFSEEKPSSRARKPRANFDFQKLTRGSLLECHLWARVHSVDLIQRVHRCTWPQAPVHLIPYPGLRQALRAAAVLPFA